MGAFDNNRLSTLLSGCKSKTKEDIVSFLSKQIEIIKNNDSASEIEIIMYKIMELLKTNLETDNFNVQDYLDVKRVLIKLTNSTLILYSDTIIELLSLENKQMMLIDLNEIISFNQKLFQFMNRTTDKILLSNVIDLEFMKEILQDPEINESITKLYEQEFSYLKENKELTKTYEKVKQQLIPQLYDMIKSRITRIRITQDRRQIIINNQSKKEAYIKYCHKKNEFRRCGLK